MSLDDAFRQLKGSDTRSKVTRATGDSRGHTDAIPVEVQVSKAATADSRQSQRVAKTAVNPFDIPDTIQQPPEPPTQTTVTRIREWDFIFWRYDNGFSELLQGIAIICIVAMSMFVGVWLMTYRPNQQPQVQPPTPVQPTANDIIYQNGQAYVMFDNRLYRWNPNTNQWEGI